jgi:hypothetical protein
VLAADMPEVIDELPVCRAVTYVELVERADWADDYAFVIATEVDPDAAT